MDYRRFLGAASAATLPHFGGPFLAAEDRRLRLAEAVEPGFWHFEISGRTARATGPADPPDLDHLPAVRGHFAAGYVAHGGGRAERLALPPAEEPPRFAPVVARRWPSGELLLDLPDFEGEAEEKARRAYEERRPLGDLSGAPATLRAAYAYAVALRASAELRVPAVPAEVRPMVGEIADGGDPVAANVLRRLAAERVRRNGGRRAARERHDRERARAGAAERVDAALSNAGATLLDLRELPEGLLNVRYAFAGERFSTVIVASTLQVVDAGICLSGEDDRLTLDSLPGVIREAIDGGDLYVTAYS